jgi:hypothetical protein
VLVAEELEFGHGVAAILERLPVFQPTERMMGHDDVTDVVPLLDLRGGRIDKHTALVVAGVGDEHRVKSPEPQGGPVVQLQIAAGERAGGNVAAA